MFYPDSHNGEHHCDTRLGPCPGPKPDDYLVIRRTGEVTVVTHYINHGNTWQSADKHRFNLDWHKVGTSGDWDYLTLSESDLERMDKTSG